MLTFFPIDEQRIKSTNIRNNSEPYKISLVSGNEKFKNTSGSISSIAEERIDHWSVDKSKDSNFRLQNLGEN